MFMIYSKDGDLALGGFPNPNLASQASCRLDFCTQATFDDVALHNRCDLDTIKPELRCPSSCTTTAAASGRSAITFPLPTVTDNRDDTIAVNCSHQSGIYQVGAFNVSGFGEA
jgi:hypothetical protein